MPRTNTPIQPAAINNSAQVLVSLRIRCQRGDATTALPSPMPRINAISTIENACNDAPRINTSDRDASTSRPIDTPPVSATKAQLQRNVFEAGPDVGVVAVSVRTISPCRRASPTAVRPTSKLTSAVICNDDTIPKVSGSEGMYRAMPAPNTAPRLLIE